MGILPGRQPGSYLIEDMAIGYVTSGRQVVEIFSEPARNDGMGSLPSGASTTQPARGPRQHDCWHRPTCPGSALRTGPGSPSSLAP